MFSFKPLNRVLRHPKPWLLLATLLYAASAYPEPSRQPLLLPKSGAYPNIVFVLDDSDSMDLRVASSQHFYAALFDPREIGYREFNAVVGSNLFPTEQSHITGARGRSSGVNGLYYNPNVRYLPWRNANGSLRPTFPADAAVVSPFLTSNPGAIAGARRTDLTDNRVMTARFCNTPLTSGFTGACPSDTQFYHPMTYFDFNGGNPTVISNFTQVKITSGQTYTRPASRTDCTVVGNIATCTYAQEAQNFSTWFTYHRSRLYATVGAVTHSFANLDDTVRLGWGQINKPPPYNLIDSGTEGNRTIINGIRLNVTAHKEWFYNWILSRSITRFGTPLRRAVDDIGQYYSRSDNRGPWGAQPSINNTTPHLACRKSFLVLFTDGYWTTDPGDEASTTAAQANVDNADGPVITHATTGQTYQYRPGPPYKDDFSNTLSDVTMYYWNRDLRPTLANTVQPDNRDPAFWQHMTTYTVGMGVEGSRRNPEDLADLTSGSLGWIIPEDFPQKFKADDLWHAAINSRGQNLSADSSDQLVAAFTNILNDIQNRSGTVASGLDVGGVVLREGTKLYASEYKAGDWTGDVVASNLNADGAVTGVAWRASDNVPAHNLRSIFTWKSNTAPTNGGIAFPFTWAELEAKGVSSRLGPAGNETLVNYLRGMPVTGARERNSRLGDIVNSAPLVVKGNVDAGYDFLPVTISSLATAGSSYRSFVRQKFARTGLVFAGANDGMLHAFDAGSGTELFAYVPEAVLPNLQELSRPDYVHRYYVDGPLREHDAYIGGGWKNIVTGSTGAGARSVFAIQVPATGGAPSEGSIMWEFNSERDADLGYVTSALETGVSSNGSWIAVFGNGLDSGAGKAIVFVLDLATGGVVQKLELDGGSGTGITGVTLIRNLNGIVTGAYAVDNKGRIWRLNASGSTFTNALGGSPLFTAKDPTNPQATMSAPTYILHPNGGTMVFVGTGKLYDDTDPANTQIQSIYGLWDKTSFVDGTGGSTISSHSELVQQTIGARQNVTVNGVARSFYTSSNNAVDYNSKRGWYMHLASPLPTGLRVLTTPQVNFGVLQAEAVVPPAGFTESCTLSTALDYLNINLNPFSGGLPGVNVFDTNGDGTANSSDLATNLGTTGGSSRWISRNRGDDAARGGGQPTGGGGGGCAAGQRSATRLSSGSRTNVCVPDIPRTRSWRQIVSQPLARP